jgi:hypothetical protein
MAHESPADTARLTTVHSLQSVSMATPRLSDSLAVVLKPHTELSEPLPKFACFLKLPLELRLEIWNLTMLPRTVVIHIHEIALPKRQEKPLVELLSVTPTPIALRVCQESRSEALRTYKLCFGTKLLERREPGNVTAFLRCPQTYFSYEMDTVHFVHIGKALSRELPVAYMKEEDLDNIRHIRTNWCDRVNKRLIENIIKFKKLETFALCWYWHEDVRDIGEEDPFQDEIDVTEATYQLLHDRPDIYQFMDAFIMARDVFAPGYKIPLLKITSMNNQQMCDHVFSLAHGRPAKWCYGPIICKRRADIS